MRVGPTFALFCLLAAASSTAGKAANWTHDQSCNPSPHYDVVFSDKVVAGQSYRKQLSKNYAFGLVPLDDGWFVNVIYRGRQVLLTIPFYPPARPYFIEGWHFRNSDNTGPNGPGPKNVNAAQRTRYLSYSPECWSGHICDAESEISAFHGPVSCFIVTVDSMELGNLVPNEKANIQRMAFTVKFAYATGYSR